MRLGRSTRGCPYFASRTLLADARLILCPYNYLLDPLIREAMGLDQYLKGAAVVIDEVLVFLSPCVCVCVPVPVCLSVGLSLSCLCLGLGLCQKGLAGL